MDKPLAMTFDDDCRIEVEIMTRPSSTGLCKVRHGDRFLVRHRLRLEPVNDAAKAILAPVAQVDEQRTSKPIDAGSNPAGSTNE